MIISKTPYRIFGGSDYQTGIKKYPGAVLSTIDKYIYITFKTCPFFEHKYRIVCQKLNCQKYKSD